MNFKAWCLTVLSMFVASCLGRYLDDPFNDGYSYRRSKQDDWVPMDFRIGTKTLRCQMYVPPGVPESIERAWSAVTKDGRAVNRAIKESSLGAKVGRMWNAFWQAEKRT